MDISEIGVKILEARKRLKITQQELASQAGVNASTISAIENGQATDIGLRRLLRVVESVGLEITIHPARMGYTLDDAKDDLREASVRRPGLKG